MLIRVEVEDTLRVPPDRFNNVKSTLEEAISEKYSDKIILRCGLCICLIEILKIGKALIPPGDGGWHMRVQFSLAVFRPFIGEVLDAVVVAQSVRGVRLSVHFFDDIFVPAELLPKLGSEPSFNDETQRWNFFHKNGSDSWELVSNHDDCRIRVKEVVFQHQELFAEQSRLLINHVRLSHQQDAHFQRYSEAFERRAKEELAASRQKRSRNESSSSDAIGKGETLGSSSSSRQGSNKRKDVARVAEGETGAGQRQLHRRLNADIGFDDDKNQASQTVYIRAMKIIGDMSLDGLGPVQWFRSSQ